jgi:hypothetical protein
MPKVKTKKSRSKKIDEDGQDTGVYVVENVVEKRIKKGKVMYLIKWEGYSSEHNTWELEENCNCPELIEQFEKSRSHEKSGGTDLILSNKKERVVSKTAAAEFKEQTTMESKGASRNSTQPDPPSLPAKKTGFDRGLQPEKILGATEQNGKLIFLMKW